MMRTLIAACILLWPSAAAAQQYRFPTTEAHAQHFYPTAYKDHNGVDWNCGTIRYSGHGGSDFGGGGFAGMDEGRDIVAAAGGNVIIVNDGEFDRCTTADCPGGGGWGNYVRIEHADGKHTIYAHLKKWSIDVEVGQAVSCGTLLGQMGSSGYSTGPHVHFEVRAANGDRHDPFWGDCSNPPSYWIEQGVYDELPMRNCPPPPVRELPERDDGDLPVLGGDPAPSDPANGDDTDPVSGGCSSGTPDSGVAIVFLVLLAIRRRTSSAHLRSGLVMRAGSRVGVE